MVVFFLFFENGLSEVICWFGMSVDGMEIDFVFVDGEVCGYVLLSDGYFVV